ncbi:GmrSD restriction endonuclease domain-containing protein [Gordonia sp. (in: high G+C Gram-positive bacteria)]|uniref:GmrSD restriction endonuclease domain-containing protein n=1 Tax=Gordonia sp. (in: high G+C Gram-positive bacteria) TaxID=84139 RepID=UPI003F9768AF
MSRSPDRSVVAAALTAMTVGGLTLTGCALPGSDQTDVAWSSVTSDGHNVAERTSTPASTSATTTANESPESADALDVLDTIPVKGRAPKTGYDRALFGQAWSDDVNVDGGHNGCDTRNDILRRDLTALTVKPRTHDCVILTGVLDDAYTGKSIAFTRGERTSTAVQIDHVVALSDAWQKGAQQLTAAERESLANDPLNLQAVDGPTNNKKKDGDAATWLPPNTAYRCTYVSRQIDVKARYRLWVTQAEKDAMTRILGSCERSGPAQGRTQTAETAIDTPVPPATPTTPVRPDTATTEGTAALYKSCAAARAAGAAPLHRGQPGYSSRLDGDDDGVACE